MPASQPNLGQSMAAKEVEFMWSSLGSPRLPEHTSDSAGLGTTWPVVPQLHRDPACSRCSLVHVRNMYRRHNRKNHWLICQTQTLCPEWARGQPIWSEISDTGLSLKYSLLSLVFTLLSTLSENGENGTVFGHCYLASFILITEALGNRCLVTNTFEIDLLTYREILWKDLSLKFTDGKTVTAW